jgi:SNF2 family DNA or RNA helicase
MKILHGTWIPDETDDFTQSGSFYLWVETDQLQPEDEDWHRYHLGLPELIPFLRQDLGIPCLNDEQLEQDIVPMYFLVPTAKDCPLPSLELSRFLEDDLPTKFSWEYWSVDCYQAGTYRKGGIVYRDRPTVVFQLLRDLHFIAQYQLAQVQLGSDLRFWYHFFQGLCAILLKDQYIPALKYRCPESPAPKKTKSKSATIARVELYPGWDLVGETYETLIARAAEAMPVSCTVGFIVCPDQPMRHENESLLRHCAEVLVNELVQSSDLPAVFTKKVEGTLVESCLQGKGWEASGSIQDQALFGQWWQWRDRISRSQSGQMFYLYFVLESPEKAEEHWQFRFFVAPRSDPSLRLAMTDYWRASLKHRAVMKAQLGEDFEQQLLFALGYAARMYPPIDQGLQTDCPEGLHLSLSDAFDFLQESAWVLEDAGFKVIVPAWYTPQGQRRIKLRLKPRASSSAKSTTPQGHLSLDKLMSYTYELAIGDEVVSEKEWQQLVNAKAPLVKFRGEWLQLDQAKMQEMLDFWQQSAKGKDPLSFLDLMRYNAGTNPNLEVDASGDRTLAKILSALNDKSQFEPIPNPKALQGSLREYQRRGVSWLSYLESLGLNGCLADDMGLGKTIQVIARLVQERSVAPAKGKKSKSVAEVPPPPTLLIAPTSVLGNWFKEIQRFAPHLKAVVHHGNQRVKVLKDFKTLCQQQDIVITSFALVRLDAKLFEGVEWHRIVLDEAQNIKNPQAAQTKAILKLKAPHRLALTGTPVENRLLDLWSIFNFLNPGYLGKEAQFRKGFERPIQVGNDPLATQTLKKMVEPFILRRVKTDPNIIQDLPDKVEQKVFCNLTREQASLYEALIRDVGAQLENSEGIQRQGIMLSTLMKLKQICNHPRQFLQDESEFTPERSHKLSRLQEMISEVMAESESLLIFTQFTEIGEALAHFLRQQMWINTYYIHGGTNRKKREQMIAEFQDKATPPSVFVLSLKAGGVGITLTKANHVFHFDRWWNPAVEDQATDRAFRIGQQKNVFVHKFVAIGTVEERIDEMITDKKKLAGTVVGSDESWLTKLDNQSFKELIALSRSAVLDN